MENFEQILISAQESFIEASARCRSVILDFLDKNGKVRIPEDNEDQLILAFMGDDDLEYVVIREIDKTGNDIIVTGDNECEYYADIEHYIPIIDTIIANCYGSDK